MWELDYRDCPSLILPDLRAKAVLVQSTARRSLDVRVSGAERCGIGFGLRPESALRWLVL